MLKAVITQKTLKHSEKMIRSFCVRIKNANGSMESITGVCDRDGLVCAVMPHPERASEPILRSDDGLNFFKGIVKG